MQVRIMLLCLFCISVSGTVTVANAQSIVSDSEKQKQWKSMENGPWDFAPDWYYFFLHKKYSGAEMYWKWDWFNSGFRVRFKEPKSDVKRIMPVRVTAEETQRQKIKKVESERKYIEEVGTMNVMFVINGEVLTPALSGSILPGITRDSAIKLLRDEGYTVTEKRITVDEVMKAAKDGSLTEMFGVGTAAIVSPVGTLGYKGEDVVINGNKVGEVSKLLYEKMMGIQRGRIADKFGWVEKVD